MTRTPITVDGRTYEFDCLTSAEELEACRGDWNALVEIDPQRTIFSSPEMFAAYRKAYPGTGGHHVVFVRREGDVVACAPMVNSREKVNRVPCRTLSFYMRRADCVAPQNRREIVEALVAYWREISPLWDVLALNELPDDSETLQLIEAAVPTWRGCRSLPVGPTDTESVLSTAGSWEDYTRGRTRHFRKRWSRVLRYAEEMEQPSYVTMHEANDADSALEDLFALEERSWKVTGGSRLTAGEKAVFLELARATSGRVTYEAAFIEVKGEKIAGLLSYFHFDRAYLFLTFFDQRYDKFSPGKWLLGTGIEKAFHDPAIKEVSFVGSYTAAKAWSSAARDYRSIRIYGRTLAGRLAYLTDRSKHSKTT